MSITILDGGMGQELVCRSGAPPTPLWSTQVMRDDPDLVRAVHDDFFAAGAQVATTNTYAVLPDRLAMEGIEDQLVALIRLAVDMARAARAAHGSGRVAGAVGPLRASYRPDLFPEPGVAAQEYAPVLEALVEGVDLLLFETMASVAMAEGALMAAAGRGVPVWLALSVDDGDGTRLRSGEALADVAPVLARYGPDAVLLNCSRPEAVSQGLPVIAALGLPFGAYANGFTGISEGFKGARPTVDTLQSRRDLNPVAYADFAEDWARIGATIIGGCCEVGPAHIAELCDRLTR